MKVKIVDKKEDVKEMTTEELAEMRFVGVKCGGLGKFLMAKICHQYVFINPGYLSFGYLGDGEMMKKKDLLKDTECSGREFYVFDNHKDPAKELYLWMAE